MILTTFMNMFIYLLISLIFGTMLIDLASATCTYMVPKFPKGYDMWSFYFKTSMKILKITI